MPLNAVSADQKIYVGKNVISVQSEFCFIFVPVSDFTGMVIGICINYDKPRN